MVLNLKTYEEVKNYFIENKLKNVVLFSQARSGSTFVSKALSEYLGFSPNKVFSEEYFIGRHYSYLKFFIKKNNNFFCNTNEFVYRRTDLKKENTLFLYLYREPKEILASYEKAKKNNYYLGWNELYERYKKFYPEKTLPSPIIWDVENGEIDDSVVFSILQRSRQRGFHSWILPQPNTLPFYNRREDILIRKP